MNKRKCEYCKEEMEGRQDKVFCSPYCKSAFHYEKNKGKAKSRFKLVDDQLKTNRRILSKYNKAGKAVIRKEELEAEGFDPNFFTNFWKTKNGDVYLFCYEYGFLKKKENNRFKYVLVLWQEYMNKK